MQIPEFYFSHNDLNLEQLGLRYLCFNKSFRWFLMHTAVRKPVICRDLCIPMFLTGLLKPLFSSAPSLRVTTLEWRSSHRCECIVRALAPYFFPFVLFLSLADLPTTPLLPAGSSLTPGSHWAVLLSTQGPL